jgi:N-acylneuraminate cytidylyltransferase
LVDQAIQTLMNDAQADSVRGVVPSGQNPFKMWRIEPDLITGGPGRMRPLLEVSGIAEPFNAPRQALPATYWQTGHIDAIRVKTIREQHSLSGKYPAILIDAHYTIDIDTLRDWANAERLLNESRGGLDYKPARAPTSRQPG